MRNGGAYLLRETTGTSSLDRTLRDAVAILAHQLVPHLVIGGLAALPRDLGVDEVVCAMYLEAWDGLAAEQ